MAGGRRLPAGRVSLDEARERARDETARLSERLRTLEPPDEPYPVEVSAGLRAFQEEVAGRVEGDREGD
jgi:nicotinate phosphoribosyltransferase